MASLPPLKSLLAFREAGLSLSFKTASERLHVTQAAVSQQIKNLEDHLGLALFIRKTRSVELTAEGRQLLGFIHEGFMKLEKGVESLLGDPDPGQLTLSAIPSFSARWLVPRLGYFQSRAPDLRIRLSPSLGLSTFDGNELDLALRFGGGSYAGLKSRFMMEDYLLPVCAAGLIDRGADIHSQVENLRFLVDESPYWDDYQEKFLKAAGLPYRANQSWFHVDEATMLIEALLCGQGIGVVRYSLTYELLERGLLICPVPYYMRSPFSYYLVAPPTHFERPKVQTFARWLSEELDVIRESWSRFQSSDTPLEEIVLEI